jgi:hypothetical protein
MAYNQYNRSENENKKFREAADGLSLVATSTGADAPADTLYEFAALSPGASATNYNVKTAGSMFGTVTNAGYVVVKNNDDAKTITVKINATTNDAINVVSGGTLTLPNLINVTNLFITTIADHSGTVEVTLFGY